MSRVKEPPEERGAISRRARWEAAPYCEFKDDNARLYALIARDIRKVLISAVIALSGMQLPWKTWLGMLG